MAGGWRQETLASPTGAQLRLYSVLPDGMPKAMVQINHGLAEHAGRYRRFADFLVGSGYAVFAHDHRGHGATTAPDAPLGQFGKGGLDAVLDDVAAVEDHASARLPGVPIVCFGHSMGALIAFNHCLRRPDGLSGAAIWNTSFDTPFLLGVLVAVLKAERFLKGSDVPSAFAGKATFDAWNREFAPNRTAFDWLSRDSAEVDAYVADPLCGFDASVGMWLSVIDAIRRTAGDKALARLPKALPVDLVAGASDPSSVHGTAIVRLGDRLKAAGLADVTVAVYPETRHEGLNEINRGAVMADFADWLDARFS